MYGKRTTENSSLETEASSKTAVMVLSFLNVFHTVLSLVSGTVLSGGIWSHSVLRASLEIWEVSFICLLIDVFEIKLSQQHLAHEQV